MSIEFWLSATPTLYGQGLADSELVTTYLQADLNGVKSAFTFRVINMGVRAYRTNQQLVLSYIRKSPRKRGQI